MNKTMKRREGEPLSKWVDRLAAALVVPWEVHEAMSEISIVSYAQGSDDASVIWQKHKRENEKKH